MNITVIVIETIILTVLFTVAVFSNSKNPVDIVYDMPQPIIDRCLELGMGVPQQEDHSLDHVWLNFNFANRPCELYPIGIVRKNCKWEHKNVFRDILVEIYAKK